jgi:hypothetical protein
VSVARRGSRSVLNIVLIVYNARINLMPHRKLEVSVVRGKSCKREIP